MDMDKTLAKICELLRNPDRAHRQAAAIVLTALAPRDGGVVEALGDALKDADSVLAGYILAALDATGSASAAPSALPLLDAPDVETRLRAVAIAARGGAAVIPEIQARLDQASPSQKMLLADLLARVHVREAVNLLLEMLLDPSLDVAKAVCDSVRRHAADASPKYREMFHKQTVQFLGSPRVKTHERAQTSVLLLLGSIGQPEARTLLLKYAEPAMSLYLRRHALIGLKGLALTGATAQSVARGILPYLDDNDEGIARHVLDVLDRLHWPGMTPAQWSRLLVSRQAPVRAAAARRLAETESAAADRELIRLLDHEDTEVREIAGNALATRKSALKLLLDTLAGEKDTEAAWRLVRILKPHSGAVDARTCKRFADMAVEELQGGSTRQEALLFFLRNINPGTADGVLQEAGLAHGKAKRWHEAVECLRRLIHTEKFDDETRFALSVYNLKLSPKDISLQRRMEDHALRGFQALLHGRSFKLLDRLKKEKVLDASDLFYVGFHFAETTGDDRLFGEEALRHVAKTWPRSEQGRAAKNKLKLAAQD
jgi:HEAT repeat protein